jgi:altronate dehydratase
MIETAPLTIRLNAADNVVVARAKIEAGTDIPGEGVAAAAPIPAGHKIATASIVAGEPIRKYNQIIGFASADIAAGTHVHTQNCEFRAFERDYAFGADTRPTDFLAEAERASFRGIERPDGRIATRNYIGVLTTVNCSATAAKHIARAFEGDALADWPNVDGVVAFTHGTGCAMALDGEGFDLLQRLMWGYARHPNMAGILLVGLGCEANQIKFLLDAYGLEEGPAFRTMNIQDTGGTRATVEAGVRIISEMLPEANKVERRDVSAANLSVALQCGGSDAYSGITANPALGAAADLVVRRRPGGAPWRHGDPRRDAGDLWRRASADPARGQPRNRREAGRAHPLVGGLHGAQRRLDGQQPLARQQGRRADHNPGEIAGRGGQGRHHQPDRRLQICRAGYGQGFRLHGFARLRPGLDHRPGGERRQSGLFHHGPRLRLRLQAVAVHQAGHQHADVSAS